MTKILAEHRVANVLITVDTTITVTVARTDTEQNFITTAAMVEITTGKYEHEFTDPAKDLKYTYTVNIDHDSNPSTLTGSRYAAVTRSYENRDTAQIYFDDHLRATPWEDADEADQVKVLIEATRRIDRLALAGDKAVSTQLLQFPRGDDTVVPTPIIEAHYEISLAILDEVEELDRPVSSRSYGGIRTTYDKDVPEPWLTAGILSKDAWIMLLPYLRKAREIKLEREN